MIQLLKSEFSVPNIQFEDGNAGLGNRDLTI